MKPLYYLPLKLLLLTSVFGYRIHPVTGRYAFHNGIDLKANYDTVYAICSGKTAVGYNNLIGVYITTLNSGLTCTYGHLSRVLIAGSVYAGQPIAISGATGRVTGPHLHLSIRYKGRPLDPLVFLYQLIQPPHE